MKSQILKLDYRALRSVASRTVDVVNAYLGCADSPKQAMSAGNVLPSRRSTEGIGQIRTFQRRPVRAFSSFQQRRLPYRLSRLDTGRFGPYVAHLETRSPTCQLVGWPSR